MQRNEDTLMILESSDPSLDNSSESSSSYDDSDESIDPSHFRDLIL